MVDCTVTVVRKAPVNETISEAELNKWMDEQDLSQIDIEVESE